MKKIIDHKTEKNMGPFWSLKGLIAGILFDTYLHTFSTDKLFHTLRIYADFM